MKKLFVTISFLLVSVYNLIAQSTQISIGTSSIKEVFNEVKFDPSSGGSVSAGIRNDPFTGTDNDCFIVKMDGAHQIVWQKVILNQGDDNLFQVIVCSNGDYIIAGWFTISGIKRAFVSRLKNSDGSIIWTSVSSATNSPYGDIFYDVTETSSKNIALTGAKNSLPGYTNGFVVLLSSDGNLIWSKVSNFGASDQFFTIAQLPNSNLLVGGFYDNGSSYNMTAFEISEGNGSTQNSSYYRVNTTLPGVGFSLNSIWPIKCYVKNNQVLFYSSFFQGYTSNSFQSIYTYDQVTKNLNGSIYFHPNLTSAIGYTFYPLTESDYVIAQSYSTNEVVISRVASNSVVYDRKILNTVNNILGMNFYNSNLIFCGYLNSNSQDAYNFFADVTLPPTNSNSCGINDLNTLQIIPNNLTASVNNVYTLDPITAMVKTNVATTDLNYAINNLCNCTAVFFSLQPTNDTICSNSNASFTISAKNTTVYQWQVNNGGGWIDLFDNGIYSGCTTATLNITSAPSSMNTYQYRATVKNSCSNSTSSPAILYVNSSANPSINISASSNPVCQGTNVTFTATGTNGGNNPIYQWQKNGNNVGSGSNSYQDNSLNNNDVIKVIMTSNANCISSSTATSSLVINVNPTVSPSVSISASGNNICPGTQVTFNANTTNGGSAPSFQWEKNGAKVGTNSNSYNDNSLNNGDIIDVILTSNAVCSSPTTARSNNISMIVNTTQKPSISIKASANTICPGVSDDFIATISNNASVATYQWQKNNINVGANSPNYVDNMLLNGDIIKVIVTTGSTCNTNATSNSIQISVIDLKKNIRYPTLSTFANTSLQLKAENISNANYLWVPSIGLNSTTISNPIFNYSLSEDYLIHITFPGTPCERIDSQLVKVIIKKDIIVPNGFSPNGDGNNDVLFPILLGIKQLNYFKVFNRWGNLVFQTNGASSSKGWDGNYKGIKQPVEAYTWIAEGVDIDGVIIKRGGNTFLIR